jgi:HEPN domain-containing protein
MKPEPRNLVTSLFFLVGFVALMGVVSTALLSAHYYSKPLEQRPYHSLHEFLRPSGKFGLIFGIAGTTGMLFNLSYLLRKRFVGLKWAGNVKNWMAFHVLTGLVSPALIVLHCANSFTSPLASLAFFAMLVVVSTGILGRYIYSSVPRSLEGHELEYSEARRALNATLSQLKSIESSSELTELISKSGQEARVPSGFIAAIGGFVLGKLRARSRYRELRSRVVENRELRRHAGEVLPLLQRLVREQMWVTRYYHLRQLMAIWRFFHRWLAISMIATALCHVAIALRFGNLWIFGGP